MSREIRRVPTDWNHPKDSKGNYIALFGDNFKETAANWWQSALEWQTYEVDRPNQEKYPWYWIWNGMPPEPEDYFPEFETKPTAYQIYETVSEGTPCSPVFLTITDMVAWLVSPIDGQSEWNRGLSDWQSMQGMTFEQAEAFINSGNTVSLIVRNGEITSGHKT